MSGVYRYSLPVILVSMLAACESMSQVVPPTETAILPSNSPAYTATALPSDTLVPTDTEMVSNTPAPTETPAPQTATWVAFVAAQTQMVGTAAAQFGSMAHLSGFSIFYANPVGTPLQSWHDVPIMLEATAGQEFQSDIYSYKATVTLQKATGFYSSQANSLDWSCMQATGTGGIGDQAEHDAEFVCGSFTIVITSFDNDPAHVLVVINKAP